VNIPYIWNIEDSILTQTVGKCIFQMNNLAVKENPEAVREKGFRECAPLVVRCAELLLGRDVVLVQKNKGIPFVANMRMVY